MKILLTSYAFAPVIGGIETVSLILAREFTAMGHAVKVATLTPGESGPYEGFEVLRRPSFRELKEAAQWCDVYFQNNISLSLAAPLLVVRRPCAVVHQTWISQPNGTIRPIDRVKRALLTFAHNIAISRAVAEALPVKSDLIPNPYDAATFYLRENVVRSEDLVALGRLVSDKGFDLLIDALARLGREGLRPKLSIIGEGPEKDALTRQAQTLGVADQVAFLGSRTGDALAEELNRYRIAVIPSRWKEPFGIVALETIACGCVPVGSRDGGLADAIGACGVTFPNGDVPALTQALSRLLNTPQSLAGFRGKAEAHLHAHRASTIAARYVKYFEALRKV